MKGHCSRSIESFRILSGWQGAVLLDRRWVVLVRCWIRWTARHLSSSLRTFDLVSGSTSHMAFDAMIGNLFCFSLSLSLSRVADQGAKVLSRAW